jgi:hypothetical protein
MMTCTSDRSGNASTGVVRSAHRPQAVSISGGEQDQEAVDDRPADQAGDHCDAPDAAVCPAWDRLDRTDGTCRLDARDHIVIALLHEAEAQSLTGPQPLGQSRFGELEAHRHRRPLQRWHRLVVQRELVTLQRLDHAIRAVAAGCGVRRRLQAAQAGLGVDQELRRGHHLLPGLQAAAHHQLIVDLLAELQLDRPVATGILSHIGQRAPAGADHRLAGHKQQLLRRGLKPNRQAHAFAQAQPGIRQLQAHAQGPGLGAGLRQDGADLGAAR